MRPLRTALLLVLATLGGASSAALPSHDRVAAGRVHPGLSASQRIGDVDPDARLERLMLVLRTRDPQGLESLLAAQQDPTSPHFRRWLTPEAYGERFGAPRAELDALVRWLSEEGFEVEDPPGGRGVVLFSGRAWQVSRTFRTRLGQFFDGSRVVLANDDVPTVPARFAGLVTGIASLDSLSRRQPLYTVNGGNYLGPADFARIYNVEPLYAADLDGNGVKIAILAESNVNRDDIVAFRQLFGLPDIPYQVVSNGPDPGVTGGGAHLEATLDVQWSGGVAPRASVILVASKNTSQSGQTIYGVDLSAVHAVNQNLADVISYSFGACEQELSPVENALYTNLWAQAAAQGISVLVASGDSGAASCETASATFGARMAVNGLGSSPYSTAVGGTSFLDRQDPAAYWEPAHDAVTKRSARSYIPEEVWNESGANGGGGLHASGGGLSTLHARPVWQDGVPGIGDDGMRALPDVAFSAAGHDSYVYVLSGAPRLGSSGTSFSAPAFAGIVALLVQKAGGRLGNLNPALYALGRSQYTTGSPAVFHDVVTGTNRVPFTGGGGPQGHAAGEGHDLATGLGSVDAYALALAWPAPPLTAAADFLLGARPAAVAVSPGGSATITLSLESPTGAEVVSAVTAGSLPAGVTALLSPTAAVWPTSSGGTGTVAYVSPSLGGTLTLTAAANATPGTYSLVLTAVAGSVRRTLTLNVTVGTTAQAAEGAETQVPVVLDVSGAGGSHYTSDLTAVNRGGSDVTMLARYVAVPGTAAQEGILLARSLPAGRAFHVPDVLAWLGKNGYRLATDGSAMLGTLHVSFAGADDPLALYAGSRTSTPNPTRKVGGAFGTFAAAVPAGSASLSEAWVYGLRESSAFRSNLALVHAPATSFASIAGPITLEVQVFDFETGEAAGAPIFVSLGSGEFQQINSVLARARGGLSSGYARVRRTSGSDRFIAYGVVNDGGAAGGSGTSDGSLITSGGSDGLIPVVLDVPAATRFRTELTLVNPGTAEAAVTLTYTPSTLLGGSGGGTVTTSLAPGRQHQVTDAIAYLRGLGLAIPDDGSRQGGTLLVSGAIALARTWNPNPDVAVGGSFGVAYPALDATRRARREAWVYGLRRDADVRSNLALADARAGDAAAVDYVVDVFDGGVGGSSPAPAFSTTIRLTGGQWTQLDNVLAGAGVTYGYARVRAASGTSDFVAYGIVNDGPEPGSRTSDGSYLPMVATE